MTFEILGLSACATAPVSQSSKPVTAATGSTEAPGLCLDSGPQTPREITSAAGTNPIRFALAPDSQSMNLCNIHTHTNAEHKGPGFSVYVGDGASGGYQCNETAQLTAAELTDPTGGQGAYKGVKPGDTIEVHWVYSTCDVAPGEGLGSCLNEACTNPLLRVEAQSFLVVNDAGAADFGDFVYENTIRNGRHQPQALPRGNGSVSRFYDGSKLQPVAVPTPPGYLECAANVHAPGYQLTAPLGCGRQRV